MTDYSSKMECGLMIVSNIEIILSSPLASHSKKKIVIIINFILCFGGRRGYLWYCKDNAHTICVWHACTLSGNGFPY